MSNRKLLLKTREQAGIKSSTQTLIEDIRLFKNTIPDDFLEMEGQGFQRHFNKLYQTNYILTCMYTKQLALKHGFSEGQIKVVQGYFPELGE